VTALPDDPEEWTDEQWLAWLAEGDAAERAAAEAAGPEPPSLPSWRKGTVAGQFLAASMIGLAEAIYGHREEPAIVREAQGEPPDDDPLEVHLDPEHPEESVALIRPWLLRQAADGADRAAKGNGATGGTGGTGDGGTGGTGGTAGAGGTGDGGGS
jgi:hypothetical protein